MENTQEIPQQQETVETVQENPTTEVTQTETTETTETVEEVVIPETVTPFEFPVAQEETPQTETQQVTEELTPEKVLEKFGDKQALLKALGYNDFAVGLLDYYEKTGDVTPYLEVKAVDYSKLPEEKIIERKLREQYATHGLSEEEVSLLVEEEMAQRYKQDPELFSEREVQLGAIKRKADAAQFRKELMERQAQFKAPEIAPKQEATQAVPTREDVIAFHRSKLLEDDTVQSFYKSKKLQFGDPQSPYNYEVKNPEQALQVIYDDRAMQYHFAKKNEQGQVLMRDGQPVLDNQKLLMASAFIMDGENLIKSLIAHGKTLGKKEVVDADENVNISKPNLNIPAEESFWQAFAKAPVR